MTSDYGTDAGEPGAAAPSTSFVGGAAAGGQKTDAGTGGTVATQAPPARDRRAAGTRTSHTWVALAAGLFFLIVILVFILQNLRSVKAHFFWGTWSIPLAVDLLLAAVLGALIMFTAGSLRIVQLRRAARRHD